MARLLIPILIVILVPGVLIPLCLAKSFRCRWLPTRNRLADVVDWVGFLGLSNRFKLRRSVTVFELGAVYCRSKLLGSVARFKRSICRPQLVQFVRGFNYSSWVSRCKSSELMARLNSLALITRSKLQQLIGHTRLRGHNSRSEISSLLDDVNLPILHQVDSSQSMAGFAQPDLDVLNCRVHLTKQEKDDSLLEVFTVEICGSIRAASDMLYTTLRISITDVTDGTEKAEPVQAHVKQWQLPDSLTFCYSAGLGKLPNSTAILSDWVQVAQLRSDWLVFPRKGKRNLRFNASVLSGQTDQEIAGAQANFAYENPTLGYIDLQQNAERTRTLAVALAFAVSAADRRLYACEVELIEDWAKSSMGISEPGPRPNNNTAQPARLVRVSKKAVRKLDKAFEQAVAFFRNGNQLDTCKICKEIVEIAPVADRYDILDLCLNAAGAKGSVVAEELTILRNLATWLEVDVDRFRAMMEKTLPVSMHEVKDAQVVLGLTSDMSEESACQQLSREYSKWNSRVTSSDPEIQAQADQMLKLIAEARSEYIT